MRTIILNSSNVDSSSNNKYKYSFPGTVRFDDDQIAVSSINLYYSWRNFTSINNNLTFSYTWYYGAGPTSQTINITITEGYYSISELNTYLQEVMISNNHYLIDSDGDNVYFLEFTVSSVYYAVQFNSYYLLTSAQATALSYTAPSGWPGYVTTNITPQITIPSTNLRYTLGFNAGTYPVVTQTTNYSKLSDFTPQVSFVESCLVACSLVNNKYSNPSNIIYTFSASDSTYGSIISNSTPNYPMFIDIQNGVYNDLTITFLDQSYNKLYILDTNITIMLVIRNKKESY